MTARQDENTSVTPPGYGLGRALRFITLVAILVAIFLGLTLWWTRLRLPGGVDVGAIDRTLAEIATERAVDVPSPTTGGDDAPIVLLSRAIHEAWDTLKDGEGKHYYHDSEKRDLQIPLPPVEVRQKHLAIAKLLETAPFTSPPYQLAGHANATTVPDADQLPHSAEARVTEELVRLVSCFRRLAGVAYQKRQESIAVDYAECGLRMLSVVGPATNLATLTHIQREAERLAEFGKSAARSFGDWNDLDRMVQAIDAFQASHATFTDALDVEILAWNDLRGSTKGSSWEQRATQNEALRQLSKLLDLRALALTDPAPAAPTESTPPAATTPPAPAAPTPAPADPRSAQLKAIDPELAKHCAYYEYCQSRILDVRDYLISVRDSEQQ